MVRRAERALGVAIRKGQAAGGILRRGERLSDALRAGYTKSSPHEFAEEHELRNTNGGIYDMTDDVSDETFEEVIVEAKVEGNLSRSNVVRKIKNLPTFSEAQSAKWQMVTDLARDRYTSAQIAKRVGMREDSLRTAAKQRGITFPADEVLGKTKRINGLDVLERIVRTVERGCDVQRLQILHEANRRGEGHTVVFENTSGEAVRVIGHVSRPREDLLGNVDHCARSGFEEPWPGATEAKISNPPQRQFGNEHPKVALCDVGTPTE